MSAVPAATSAECDTMTMPTLPLMLHGASSRTSQTARDDQRARARARVHVADRALAEEGGAAADRLHRHGRLGRRVGGRGDGSPPAGERIARPAPSTSSMVFWPTSDLPRALTASIAAPKARDEVGAVGLGRQLLAERHEQRAVERPGRAADLHHQRRCRSPSAPPAAAWRRCASRSASTASKPRFMLRPWSPSPIAWSSAVSSSAWLRSITRCGDRLDQALGRPSASSDRMRSCGGVSCRLPIRLPAASK